MTGIHEDDTYDGGRLCPDITTGPGGHHPECTCSLCDPDDSAGVRGVEPDPQTVREIAREVATIALHDAVHVDQWISAVVNSKFGNECSQFRAPLHTAVARRMAVVKPSWPAEQPPAPPTAEQDGALTAAELAELRASIEHLSGPDAWDEDRLEPALIPVTHYVPRLLAALDALRARVAELESAVATAEQDGDWATHAVELLTAVVDPECDSDGYGNCATHGVLVLEAGAQCPHALARAFLAGSRAHLGALDARTADGSAPRGPHRGNPSCEGCPECIGYTDPSEPDDADGSAG